jgi:hypothetical protein
METATAIPRKIPIIIKTIPRIQTILPLGSPLLSAIAPKTMAAMPKSGGKNKTLIHAQTNPMIDNVL